MFRVLWGHEEDVLEFECLGGNGGCCVPFTFLTALSVFVSFSLSVFLIVII